jgi:hypothetical protein
VARPGGSSSLKQRSDFGDVTGRLAEIYRGECFFFICLTWQTQRIVYQPPRNIIQMTRRLQRP